MRIKKNQWVSVGIAMVLTVAVGFFSQTKGASVGKDATYNEYVRDIIRGSKDARAASGLEMFEHAPGTATVTAYCSNPGSCLYDGPDLQQGCYFVGEAPKSISGSVHPAGIVYREGQWYVRYAGDGKLKEAYWNPETQKFVGAWTVGEYSRPITCGSTDT